MSNMTAHVTLLYESDRSKLQNVRNYLRCGKDLYYVHESHICPSPNHSFWKQSHVKVVVYATSFYQDLVAMILGYNAVILEDDWDDTVHLDNHPVGIACICVVNKVFSTRYS